MSKSILGRKVGMTQIFLEDGSLIPVTVLEAGPVVVVQKKTTAKDGYEALKVGFLPKKEKRVNKPDKGQFDKVKVAPTKYLKEIKVESIDQYEVGQEIKVSDLFQAGDRVDVTGTSKGHGFQGNIKRHGQARGPETHGSKYHRRPGSMGANTSPGHVFKGKKLPGHMGVSKVTIQNLDVVRIDAERNLMIVKGSVPGPKGGLVVIRETVKVGK